MLYPEHLLKLIQVLKRLPGVGNKSAERFAFHLLSSPEEQLLELGELVIATKTKLQQCIACGCLKGDEGCHFCDLSLRDTGMMCVIASPRDVFAIEETHEYRGIYHVLFRPFISIRPSEVQNTSPSIILKNAWQTWMSKKLS